MSESKDFLRRFINEKSQFIELGNGESMKVKFLGASPVKTNFQGKIVDSMRYRFEKDGKEMSWDRTSREFAKQISQYEEGDLLWIKKTGERNLTKYEVRKIE